MHFRFVSAAQMRLNVFYFKSSANTIHRNKNWCVSEVSDAEDKLAHVFDRSWKMRDEERNAKHTDIFVGRSRQARTEIRRWVQNALRKCIWNKRYSWKCIQIWSLTCDKREDDRIIQLRENKYSCGVAQGQTWLSQGTLDVLVILFSTILHYLMKSLIHNHLINRLSRFSGSWRMAQGLLGAQPGPWGRQVGVGRGGGRRPWGPGGAPSHPWPMSHKPPLIAD